MTESRSVLLIDESNRDEAFEVVAITTEVDELAARAAQHELAAPTFAADGPFVDDEVERIWKSPEDLHIHHVATAGPARPRSFDLSRRAPAVERSYANHFL